MRQLPGVGCGITWQALSEATYLGQSLPMAKPSRPAAELKLRCSRDPSPPCRALLPSAAGLLGFPGGQALVDAPGHLQQLATSSHAKRCRGVQLAGPLVVPEKGEAA